jgi:Ca2+-dependent lipid-binding protein
MKPALLGSLTVNCKSAKLEKDADTFGKMDPFVRLTVGKVSKVTNVQEEGGVNPVWNQVLEFEINGEDEFVDIALLDSDGEKADSLGSGSLDFTALAKLPNKCEPLKVYLQQKGETVGTLELEVTFLPKKAKKLAITIEKADLKEDLDFWNKMDPFVIVTIGVTTKRTTIKEEVGKQPVWNEKLEFDVVL